MTSAKSIIRQKDQKFTARQTAFIKAYFDPKSETFGNGLQSAIKAGFSKHYSEVLASRELGWLSEIVSKSRKMVIKAESNLDEALSWDIWEPMMGSSGPIVDPKTKRPYMRRDPRIMAIKWDATKFTLERLNPKEFGKREYVESEHTGEIHVYHIPTRQTPEEWEKGFRNKNSNPMSR